MTGKAVATGATTPLVLRAIATTTAMRDVVAMTTGVKTAAGRTSEKRFPLIGQSLSREMREWNSK